MVNNYCIAIGPNHAAVRHLPHRLRLDGQDFEFSDPAKIDCLVCHDTTGTYRKDPLKAGMPDPELDLAAIAQKVGRPSRQACGSCHFFSGGAANAKHGDLEPVLADPPARLRLAHGRPRDALPGLPHDRTTIGSPGCP